jgi:hypothetical protein
MECGYAALRALLPQPWTQVEAARVQSFKRNKLQIEIGDKATCTFLRLS